MPQILGITQARPHIGELTGRRERCAEPVAWRRVFGIVGAYACARERH
ncbi:hypothetical protein [Streptomyces sp. NPDC014995]